MDRYYEADASASTPDLTTLASSGYPTNGDSSLGVAATKPGAAWFYAVTEEIRAAIVAGGITPDATSISQLASALAAHLFPIGGLYAYDATADYVVSQVVLYNGLLYKCLTANGASSTVVTPGSDSSYWDMLPSASEIVGNITAYDLCGDGAAQHNSLYRGKDITDDFDDGTFTTNVANGTFKDIFPGDYIQKDVTVNGTTYSAKWVVGDCDYFWQYGDTKPGAHHVLVFPDIRLGTSAMNSTNTTEGGYLGSYMRTTTIPLVVTGITNAFTSSHLVTFREFLSNSVNTSLASLNGHGWTGQATGGAWTSSTANLFNEYMVYGSGHWNAGGVDRHDCPRQVSAFRLSPTLYNCDLDGNYYDWWLRDVASSADFAFVYWGGDAAYGSASFSLGVRPFCLLR